MKATTIFYLVLGTFIFPIFVPGPLLPLPLAQAQGSNYSEPSEKYSREELSQMLAPIALYPDALLAQVLMASTYPVEVVEADRWVRRNSGLKGEDLDDVLLDMNWDPSVKAVCHFPPILALMSERISETTELGNAFLAQEDEVMDVVQELRAKAYEQGNLTTNDKQKVIVERETIIIKQADPRVVYVSYYDPFYVYGPWWYPAYPPYYWGPPGVRIGVGISYWPGFYFGFAFGNWSYFNWHRHYIHIDVRHRPRFVRHDRWVAHPPGRWHHAPAHRRGVAYRDQHTATKYGQHPPRSRDFQRDTRGYSEHRAPDRNRRVGDGAWGDHHDRRREDAVRTERNRRAPSPATPDNPERERTDRVRQERERVERGKREGLQQVDPKNQERQRIERTRQAPLPATPDNPVRERTDRVRQERERVERGKREGSQRIDSENQERQRIERTRQVPAPVAPDNPVRERTDQVRQERKRVESEQQLKSRDNAVNQAGGAVLKRQPGAHGRSNQQGTGGHSRGRERSDGNSRGGRGDQSRNK
ncbi:MAG: DUF3300 domain-containing protein [Desulfobacterales bacterium]|jgi:hypothetical protein|nr:DUF3300 domain-containing protein [Desulfobacterales bacterium]